MKKILIIILSASLFIFASIVPVERAKKVAENWYFNYDKTSVSQGSVVEKVLTKEYLGQPTWYVFKFTKGFVIVAADDNVNPILGFSYHGIIQDDDLNNLRNPFASRFSSFDKQIVHNIREKKADRLNKQKEWLAIESNKFPVKPAATKDVANLLTTKWHQDYPFNYACPINCPAGCVATAMSQILYFYQGPGYGEGSNSYIDGYGDTTGSHSVDFSTQSYDYELIANCPYGSSFNTQAKVDEIAKITYHLGVSVNMDYNTDGSSAFLTDALYAYQNNWACPTATYNIHGTITDSSYFSSTIKNEVDDFRPLQWAGESAGLVHSFVLCGYQNLAPGGYWYYINWGWGGSYDGWYRLNDLTPGTTDYSISQQSIKGIVIDWWPPYIWAPPTNTTASVAENENVLLEWEWDYPTLTLSRFEIFKNGEFLAAIPDSIREFTDTSLSQGSYEYKIMSFYSSSYYDYSADRTVSVEIVSVPDCPEPVNLKASVTLFNRQKIDLIWTKPFVGTTYFSDDFESNAHFDNPVGWWQKGSNDAWPNITTWNDLNPDIGLPGFVAIHTDYLPQWVFQGELSAGANGNGEEFTYTFIVSDSSFTLPGGTGKADFYFYCYDGTEQGLFLFSGTQGGNPEGNITVLREYKTGDAEWIRDEIDLSPYSGTYRLGLYKKTIGGGSLFCIDEIVLGVDSYPSGNQPLSYDLYRNGSFVVNVPAAGFEETYEDNGFFDGWNEYYLKAVYAAGTSLPTVRTSVWIDANPVPHLLDGVFDNISEEVDLSWYAPYHYPIHWFGYEYEGDNWFYLSYDKVGTGEIQKARTYFSALDFGMGYPVHLEKVSAAFFEDTGVEDWTSDQFQFSIGTGTAGSETVFHTSGWLTALGDGTRIDYELPDTLTLTEDWYVEIILGSPSDGTPTVLTNVHKEGTDPDHWNSVWYWTGGGAHNPGWYAYRYDSPYEFEDFDFQCYGYNDEPLILKKTGSEKSVEFYSLKTTLDRVISFETKMPRTEQRTMPLIKDGGKGLDSYNIYRNSTLIGNTTNKYFTDTDPVSSNTYYITAVYSDPSGESEPSNQVTLGPPPVIQMPDLITNTLYSGTESKIDFTIGNTGSGYLNYFISFQYTDSMQQAVTGTDEHFDESLGTFTTSGTGSWINSAAAPVFDGNYARLESSSTSTKDSYLTSAEFSLDGAVFTTLTYSYIFEWTEGSWLSVQYFDGTNWVNLITHGSDQPQWKSATHNIPNTAIRIKFRGYFPRSSGFWIGLDNIKVNGTELLIDEWFTLVSATEGIIPNQSQGTLECNFNASNLAAGEYHGKIIVSSDDPVNPVAETPVILTVEPSGIEYNSLPLITELYQNYPNPFNPSTEIRFSIETDSDVHLKIFNTAGQLVAVAADKFMKKGFYKIPVSTSELSAGIYFYTLDAAGKTLTKKMTVLK